MCKCHVTVSAERSLFVYTARARTHHRHRTVRASRQAVGGVAFSPQSQSATTLMTVVVFGVIVVVVVCREFIAETIRAATRSSAERRALAAYCDLLSATSAGAINDATF